MTENKVCIECPYCKQIIEIDLSEHDKDIKTDVLKEYMLKDCNSCKNHLKEQIRAEERERIIEKINRELSNSNNSQYLCENGEIIKTDVGYVQEWFEEYKKQLKEQK